MTTATVNLDLTQYVRVNVGQSPVVLQAPRDAVRIVYSETQPARSNTTFHLIGGDGPLWTDAHNDTNIWALAMTDRSSLTVTEYTDHAAQAAAASSIGLLKRTAVVSAAGDSVVYTPAPGAAIRLYFFGYSAGADVTGCLVSLKLEGYNGGVAVDRQYLVAAGQPYARNIQAGHRYIQGAADGRLIVTASAAQTVYINYEIDEV